MPAVKNQLPENEQTKSASGSWVEFYRQIFGRVTSHGMFIPEIDGLRFVAIMAVVLYHTTDSIRQKTSNMIFEYKDQNLLSWLFLKGDCGVPLFFIISGFILSLPFIKSAITEKSVSLKRFYLRRLTRLEPPYIVNLLFWMSLICIFKNIPISELTPHFIASFFYIHNIVYTSPSTINVVAWSLEIEAQFYIIAPIFFYAMLKFPPKIRQLTLLTILILTTLMHYFNNHIFKDNHLNLIGNYEYFISGVLLADCYHSYYLPEKGKTIAWDISGLFCWLLIPYLWSKSNMTFFVPYIALLAYWSTFRGKLLNLFFRFSPIVLTGGMCYSIYLYHFVFISLAGNYTLSLIHIDNYYIYLFTQAALISGLALTGSVPFFLLIEKPFMKWKIT